MTGGRVVVLGPAGRNFAAGMSGGIAYVLDEECRFDSLCNRSMVDLEKLDDPDEQRFVRDLIERHLEYTGSDKAKSVLDFWDENVARFVKVMPVEYRRVLDRLEKEKVVKYG